MAAVGVEVAGSWFPTSGIVGFFIALLLLSIFLTALCSECTRRSFELGDSEADKDPSVLIKVAKLEEVMEERENPMMNLKDETNLNPSKGNTVAFTPWRRHLEAPQNHNDGQANGVEAVSHSETAGESNPEEETPAPLTLWRTHLKPDENISTAPDNIYHTIGGGGSSAHASSMLTNHGPGEEPGVCSGDSVHVNSVYAQLSMNERPATPPPPPPPPPPQEELEEEVSAPPPPAPPLPNRRTLEG